MNACRSLLSFFLAGALAPAALAQSVAFSRTPVDPAQLVVQSYTPTVFCAEELRDAANQLFGDTLAVAMVQEDGKTKQSGFATVPHFVVLGSLVLVRDTSEQGLKILQTLRDLEAVEAKRLKDVQDAREGSDRRIELDDESVAEVDTFELRPRYVSFDTLYAAIKPFQRELRMPGHAPGEKTWNTIGIERSNLIVVRETPKRLAEIQEYVARIDRPRPQVVLTVTLLRGAAEGEASDEQPKALAENLKAMLPYRGYRTIGVGVLRCAMEAGQSCELKTEHADGGTWSISFLPAAFSAETNEFSISHCRFAVTAATRNENGARLVGGNAGLVTQSFETNLTFRANEYVVLGGAGTDPVLVVLRAQVVSQDH